MTKPTNVPVDRRTFVRDAALAAAAASPLGGVIGGLGGLLAQSRPRYSASRLVVNGETRPFTMLCLGDSVMWGQGLRDSSKFTALVQAWLQRKMPDRKVNRYVYARSGATITTDPGFDETNIKAWMNDRSLGEVPCSWPYVNQQLAVAKSDMAAQQISADAVDLILVDGGINDMKVTTLLQEFNSKSTIVDASKKYCKNEMLNLLNRIPAAFPKAKILVTGYFPVISEESDLGFITALIAFPATPPAAGELTRETRSRLAALSTAWYDASNSDLAAAVAAFNSKWGWSQSRASFARIPWQPQHSYGGPDTRLWLIGAPIDEVYAERQAGCRAAGDWFAQKGLDITCIEAKMGHPNPAGARAYADACQAQLAQYVPAWAGLKLMSACLDMDPMPRTGVATTLTVHATADGPAGKITVPATVRVGTQSFRTDTPVPVTLCVNHTAAVIDQSGLKPVREKTGTSLVCSPLTVSAPGYTDVVISNYLSAKPLP
jgi:lysophospholipase L1-like esterase